MLKTTAEKFILKAMRPWLGSEHAAMHWYQFEKFSPDGLTAQDLVQKGRAYEVMQYLHHLHYGGVS